MATSPAVVIDANLAIGVVLPLSSTAALDALAGWRNQRTRLVAPDLLLAEAVTGLRKLVFGKLLAPEDARAALDALFTLDIETVPLNNTLCRSALAWAERLGQSKAYDGLYLALAEQLGAEFWTADARLARCAQQAGANWVHLLPEA